MVINVEVSSAGQYINPARQTFIPVYPPTQVPTASTVPVTYGVDGDVMWMGNSQPLPNDGNIYSSGMWYDLPASNFVVGHRYMFYAEFAAMPGRTQTVANFWINHNTVVTLNALTDGLNETVWSGIGTVVTFTAPTGTGVAGFRVQVIGSRDSTASSALWGFRFRNLWYTDLDAATANPEPFTWYPVLCDSKSLDIRYGRSRFTQRYEVGTFTIELNNVKGDYRYDPDSPNGFGPGRFLRATATYNGTTYPLCMGVIDSVDLAMELDGTTTASLTVLDPTNLISQVDTPSFSSLFRPAVGYISGQRITDLLTAGGIDDQFYAVDAGYWWMQAIKASQRPVRDEIGVTADSEGGSFFATRAGILTYKDRNWPNADPRLYQEQAHFTAVPNGIIVDYSGGQPPSPDEVIICPHDVDIEWNRDRIINRIQLSSAGGSSSVYENAASQKKYGVIDYQRTDFVWAKANQTPAYNASVNSLIPTYKATRANDYFATSLDATMRFDQVGYSPQEGNWEFTLSVFLNWLVRASYVHATEIPSETSLGENLWGFTCQLNVQSIVHRITPREWRTTIQLDQPINYKELTPLLPSGRGWDDAIWDVDLWDQLTGAGWSTGAKWSTTGTVWR